MRTKSLIIIFITLLYGANLFMPAIASNEKIPIFSELLSGESESSESKIDTAADDEITIAFDLLPYIITSNLLHYNDENNLFSLVQDVSLLPPEILAWG